MRNLQHTYIFAFLNMTRIPRFAHHSQKLIKRKLISRVLFGTLNTRNISTAGRIFCVRQIMKKIYDSTSAIYGIENRIRISV